MRFLIGFFIIMAISGCANNVSFSVADNMQTVGFWYGLWHGMIVPFTWLVSLFSDSTAIYAIYNNGGWYDFGFMLGIGALSSSSSTTVKKIGYKKYKTPDPLLYDYYTKGTLY